MKALPLSILERVPDRLLLGPGPSNSPQSVLAASAKPLLGHLDPQFSVFLDEIQVMLRQVFQTVNPVTFAVSGTGSAGMETLAVNLFEPGDTVVVGKNGVFGGRIVEALTKLGVTAVPIEAPWGEPIDLAAAKVALARAGKPAALWVVHAETSTGVLQPGLAALSGAAHEAGALFLVDCVTSLGGVELRVDDWGIDAAFSGTQKCLNITPGLSPVTLGARALEKLKARRTPVPSWYFDLQAILKYWEAAEGKRVYHHTAPITPLYALHEGLRLVLQDGLDARWLRHGVHAEALAEGLAALGFKYRVADRKQRLPMLHAVQAPSWLTPADRGLLLQDYGIEIGAGLGAWAADTWRVGLMGINAHRDVVLRLLGALDELAIKRGGRVGGVLAAERTYTR